VTYTVPGMKDDSAETIVALLQERLNSLNDLALTLKHVHWNVVGPNFIAVHTMLDPQVEAVRGMVDQTAERIATLGGSPCGTPGALVTQRSWDDTPLAARTRSSTSLPWTSSTPASSKGSARRSRPLTNSTTSPRTCSSRTPVGWSSSTGSSGRTWSGPMAR
jgi:Ferritin-like domain